MEVYQAAPIANFIREKSLGLLGGMIVVSILKFFGILDVGSWQSFGIVAISLFLLFLVARIRLSMVNARLQRELDNAAG